MKKLRVGIIGIGKIGLAQIKAIKSIENSGYAELIAISSRDPRKAQAICKHYGIPACYSDYRIMLENAALDVVHNCTPNMVHYEINKQSILVGCHILSEKPLTVNSAQSAELVALAGEKGVLSAVNFVYRHYSVIQHIKKMIEECWFGNVYAVHGTYLQDWLLYDTDYDWRVEARLGGPSRALADIGSHWLDIAQFILGQNITELVADFATFVPTRGKLIGKGAADLQTIEVDTEDYASMLFRFDRGAHGSLTVSQVSAGQKSGLSFEIDCSKASVCWTHEHPGYAEIRYRDASKRILAGNGELLQTESGEIAKKGSQSAENISIAQKNMIENFYRSILYSEKPSYADFEEGHRIVCIVEAAIKSQHNGTWVSV